MELTLCVLVALPAILLAVPVSSPAVRNAFGLQQFAQSAECIHNNNCPIVTPGDDASSYQQQ